LIKKIKLEKYHYVALVGWVAKIFTVIFSFINIRLLIDLIGIDGYGTFSIIFSLFGWFALFNLGLPTAVQNEVSKYRVNQFNLDRLLVAVQSILLIIFFFSIPIVFILSSLINNFILGNLYFFNFYSLYSIFIFALLIGFGEVFNRILFAIHKGYIPHSYPAISAFLTCIILLFLKKIDLDNISITILVFFIPNIILLLFSYYYSIGLRSFLLEKQVITDIFQKAKNFFIFALLATITLKVDYIIMSLVLESKDIVIYNLAMKIFGLSSFLYMAILLPLHSVLSELIILNKYNEVIKKIKLNISIGFSLVVSFSLFFLQFNNWIIKLLIGDEQLKIEPLFIFVLCIYFLIRVWTDTFNTVFQSMNKVEILIIALPFQAFISILFQYVLGKEYGIIGITLGISISFLFTVAWFLPYKLLIHIRKA